MTEESAKITPVKIGELIDALDFVSFDGMAENEAYIQISTGTVHWKSDAIDPKDGGLPEDFEATDDYVAVPHRRDLDLGSRLVFAFAEEAMPRDCDTVRDMFRKRGAYRRFKQLLEDRQMLDRWHAFEEKATEAALRAWCAQNGVMLEGDQGLGSRI